MNHQATDPTQGLLVIIFALAGGYILFFKFLNSIGKNDNSTIIYAGLGILCGYISEVLAKTPNVTLIVGGFIEGNGVALIILAITGMGGIFFYWVKNSVQNTVLKNFPEAIGLRDTLLMILIEDIRLQLKLAINRIRETGGVL